MISLQLWHGDKGAFAPWPRKRVLTPLDLWSECVKLCGLSDHFILATYFSLAELQFLPVVTEGFAIQEYANGSLDCQFAVRGHGTLEVYDLARWFDRKSLAKAAESFGLEKKEWDTRHVTRADLHKREFRDYAVHDAYLCYEMLTRLRVEFNLVAGIDPVRHKTPAGTSAAVFRRKYVKRDYHCDVDAARYAAMRGGWGGRAEVFRRGRLPGRYTEYDITSAYPASAIALGKMPYQGCWTDRTDARTLERAVGGFVLVRFQFSREERYPCLPVHATRFMLYPQTGQTWCTLHEYRVAREFGALTDVLEAWTYREGTTALRDYMQWAIAEREKCAGPRRHMFKLMANALVGKFAQHVDKVSMAEYQRIAGEIGCPLDEVVALTRDELRALGAKTYTSIGSVWMPEWNGLITGYTRACLARMIRAGDPIYCHTDSVWCAGDLDSSESPLSFGPKTRGRAVVARTRFAMLGDEWSRKAAYEGRAHIAHHAVWSLTAAVDMLRAFNGRDIVRKYPVDKPLKLREAIKSGRTPGEWVRIWRKATTKWDGKRRLRADGTTRPWTSVAECAEAGYLKGNWEDTLANDTVLERE